MLDDFEIQDDIERFAGLGQRLRRAVPVVDLETRLRGMGAGDFHRLHPGIDPGDRRAQPGHRLADQAAAASEVDNAQAVERPAARRVQAEVSADRVANQAEPRRVQPVQRRKLAARIPPFPGHGGEAGNLGLVDRRAGGPCVPSGRRSGVAAAILRCFGHGVPVAQVLTLSYVWRARSAENRWQKSTGNKPLAINHWQ